VILQLARASRILQIRIEAEIRNEQILK